MSDAVIKVSGISKQYQIGASQESYGSLRDTIMRSVSEPFRKIRNFQFKQPEEIQTIWALKNVTFEVFRGETVGIIGANGAGKSTLLKVLSRITKPTEGNAKIRGRIGSLLEVGTGFHPELTGRENIYLNGVILGMKRHEIEKKFDEIVDFAEVEKFLDTPVKRFSSGMYVRLAFAVAAHLEPEILLVDEVLAVGDAAFQKKCLGKMEDVAHQGRTVLFVSHNMGTIRTLCNRGILLSKGEVKFDGTSQNAIDKYLEEMETNAVVDLAKRFTSDPSSIAWFTGISFRGETGNYIDTVISGQSLDIVLAYRSHSEDAKLEFAIGIYNSMGEKFLHFGTHYSLSTPAANYPHEGEIICRFKKMPLVAGRYKINLSIHHRGSRVDHVTGAAILNVQPGDFFGTGKTPPRADNKIFVEHEWILTEA